MTTKKKEPTPLDTLGRTLHHYYSTDLTDVK